MVRSLTHDQKLTVTQHRKYDQRLSLNSSVSLEIQLNTSEIHICLCVLQFLTPHLSVYCSSLVPDYMTEELKLILQHKKVKLPFPF